MHIAGVVAGSMNLSSTLAPPRLAPATYPTAMRVKSAECGHLTAVLVDWAFINYCDLL